TDLLKNLESSHVFHPDVEYNKIRFFTANLFQRFLSAASGVYFIPGFFKFITEEGADVLLIIDYQNLFHSAQPVVYCVKFEKRFSRVYIKFNCNFAASDILDISHGGSHTSSTFEPLTPGTMPAFASTSGGSVPAT